MSARHRIGLRARFLLACGLLVITAVAASFFTLAALAQLRATARALVRQSDETTAALATLSSLIEREDDAVLLTLGGSRDGISTLSAERKSADIASARLRQILGAAGEKERADEVLRLIGTYRTAVDKLLRDPRRDDALENYHRDVNPPLRQAVGAIGSIRTEYFERTQRALARASDEVERTRGVVLAIAVISLGVAVVVGLRLSRDVIGPLRQLTRGANAIREGNFEARIQCGEGDEIADVAAAFNHMAERLSEFRRMNLEEILRAKGALEATLRALPDAVLLIDTTGTIAAVNPAAITLFRGLAASHQPHELPQHAEDLVAIGLPPDRLRAALQGQLMPPQPVNLTGALRCEVGGESRRLLPRIVKTGSPEDPASGAVVVLSDVTELARLDELRAEHVAVASHELRTPVTTLRMTLLMLQELAASLPAQVRELAATALIGAEQLKETVDELLDLARIESGKLMLRPEPLEVGRLVADAVQTASPRAVDARVSLEQDIPSGLPLLLGDRARLRSVLDNLIDNALKYTPPSGVITLRVASPGDPLRPTLTITISDSGPGIPSEFRARVFEKFFRVEHYQVTTRNGTHGVGIGLYLCREIVQLHGGHIHCEARPDGPGTSFVITLPLPGHGLQPTANAEGSAAVA